MLVWNTVGEMMVDMMSRTCGHITAHLPHTVSFFPRLLQPVAITICCRSTNLCHISPNRGHIQGVPPAPKLRRYLRRISSLARRIASYIFASSPLIAPPLSYHRARNGVVSCVYSSPSKPHRRFPLTASSHIVASFSLQPDAPQTSPYHQVCVHVSYRPRNRAITFASHPPNRVTIFVSLRHSRTPLSSHRIKPRHNCLPTFLSSHQSCAGICVSPRRIGSSHLHIAAPSRVNTLVSYRQTASHITSLSLSLLPSNSSRRLFSHNTKPRHDFVSLEFVPPCHQAIATIIRLISPCRVSTFLSPVTLTRAAAFRPAAPRYKLSSRRHIIIIIALRRFLSRHTQNPLRNLCRAPPNHIVAFVVTASSRAAHIVSFLHHFPIITKNRPTFHVSPAEARHHFRLTVLSHKTVPQFYHFVFKTLQLCSPLVVPTRHRPHLVPAGSHHHFHLTAPSHCHHFLPIPPNRVDIVYDSSRQVASSPSPYNHQVAPPVSSSHTNPPSLFLSPRQINPPNRTASFVSLSLSLSLTHTYV
jgi:hypothetical protein